MTELMGAFGSPPRQKSSPPRSLKSSRRPLPPRHYQPLSARPQRFSHDSFLNEDDDSSSVGSTAPDLAERKAEYERAVREIKLLALEVGIVRRAEPEKGASKIAEDSSSVDAVPAPEIPSSVVAPTLRLEDKLPESAPAFKSSDACSLRKAMTRRAVENGVVSIGGDDENDAQLSGNGNRAGNGLPAMKLLSRSPPRLSDGATNLAAAAAIAADPAAATAGAVAAQQPRRRSSNSWLYPGDDALTFGGADEGGGSSSSGAQTVVFYDSHNLFDLYGCGPRSRHRPPTARTNYLHACERQRLAPLPLLDRLQEMTDAPQSCFFNQSAGALDLSTGGTVVPAIGAVSSNGSSSNQTASHGNGSGNGCVGSSGGGSGRGKGPAAGMPGAAATPAASANLVSSAARGGRGPGGTVFALELRRYGLGKGRAMALSVFLGSCSIKIRRLDISENGLSDVSAAAILSALAGQKFLTHLDLSGNAVGGRDAVAALTSLLEEPALRLVTLRLENCRLGASAIRALSPTLERSRHLTALSLARNQLGGNVSGLAALIRLNASITQLDLSYNALAGVKAAIIAEAVGVNNRITSLDVSFNSFNCQATTKLAAALTLNSVLTALSVAYNGIAEAECLAIAEAITCGGSVRRLDMSGNPVGRLGADALVSLMSDGNGVAVAMADCNLEVSGMGQHASAGGGGSGGSSGFGSSGGSSGRRKTFSATNPNGFYRLRLSDPYDRSIARQLQRLAYSQSGECWRGERLNGQPFHFPEEDPTAWRLPPDGLLELTFVANRPVKALPLGPPGFERLLESIVHACRDGGGEPCAVRLVGSMLRSHRLDVVQSWRVLRCFAQPDCRVQVAPALYLAIEDTDAATDVLKELNQLERSRAIANIGKYYHIFSSSNPTGHYQLNLGMSSERLVAVRLCEINELERRVRRLANLYDVSEGGDWDGFRRCLLNGKPFKIKPGWDIPDNGLLQLDYVSPLHAGCGPGAHALTPNQFKTFVAVNVTFEEQPKLSFGPSEAELRAIFNQIDKDGNALLAAEELHAELRHMSKPPDLQVIKDFVTQVDKDGNGEVCFVEFSEMWLLLIQRLRRQERGANLRRLAASTFLSTAQLLDVWSCVEDPAERLPLLPDFFRRVTDPERIGPALAAMPVAEAEAVAGALGWLNVLNPFAPDGNYKLNYAKYDERTTARVLLQLAVPATQQRSGGAGGGGGGSGNTRVTLNDLFEGSTLDGEPLDVPDSWRMPKMLPSRGTWAFRLRLTCRDDTTDLPPRQICREVAETFLGWEFADGDCAPVNSKAAAAAAAAVAGAAAVTGAAAATGGVRRATGTPAGKDLLDVAAAAIRRREERLRAALAEVPLNDRGTVLAPSSAKA